MPKIVFVKPVRGRRVLDPVTLQPLSAEGMAVELTSYWRRREIDGDVTLASRLPARGGACETENTKKRK